jgi:hypothetical protein
MGPASDAFVREFLDGFLENRFINGSLTSDAYHAHRVALHAEEFRRAAEALFAASPSPVEVPGYGPLRIVQLREMNGTEFPFLQGLLPTRTTKSRVTCFIGHRFLREIEGPLRFNLAHLLNPYGARLKWSA